MSDPHLVTLSDGRRLSYGEFGDPNGAPVFYFHGFPGSRLDGHFGHASAQARGIRFITVERPGYGHSSPQPGRRLLDWPRDVAQLADALGLERFGVMGVSGGAPYALAVAWALPGRVLGVALGAGLGPTTDPSVRRGMPLPLRTGLALARRSRRLHDATLRGVTAPLVRRDPRAAIGLFWLASPEVDRRTLDQDDIRAIVRTTFAEGLRQGTAAVTADSYIYASPWGFDPAQIHPPVALWHGQEDRVVPVAFGQHLARTLPGCQAHIMPGLAHFSLVQQHLDDMMEALIGFHRQI